MRTIRIALAQINTTVGGLAPNSGKILQFAAWARDEGADIVVFPELSITGYPPEDLLLKKHFIRDNAQALKAAAKKIKGITALIGFVDQDRKGLAYNAAALIRNGRVAAVYRKNHLPNYGVFDEKRYFTPGHQARTFSLRGVKIGINICEDIWEQGSVCAQEAKAGACILLNLSASPYHCGKTDERKNVLARCAKSNRVYVGYCNLVGGQDELVFDGGSMVLDPQGAVIARGASFAEDLVLADVEVPEKKKTVGSAMDPLRSRIVPPLDPVEEIYGALVLGTRDYLFKNGFKKAVLGISGGIDSALVAAIAADAIGKENVLAVSMPSRYTSQGTKTDAALVARNLGVSFAEIPIDGIFGTYLKTLETVFKGQAVNIAEENLQARIRGNILMAISNKFGHLVLTTGNKSEISVGYCTLYGDMAGGFAVIKDVPKTTVYQLAHFVNQRAGRPLILESIISRAPTAELKKGQKDQDSLPPYDVLDPVLEAYIEKDQGLQTIKDQKGGKHLAKRIIQLVDAMEYKRRQAPIGVKITPKAFGKDRRLPVTNHYKES